MQKKRGMKINLSNRWLYIFILFGFLAILGTGVYAATYTSSGAGHPYTEISTCSANQMLKMNAAGTAWTCAAAPTGTGAETDPEVNTITNGANYFCQAGKVNTANTLAVNCNRSISSLFSSGFSMNGADIYFNSVNGDNGQIRAVKAISFDWSSMASYEDSGYHGIESKSETGTFDDDMRINSYGNVIVTIDSNKNDGLPSSAGAHFVIQKESKTDGTDLFYIYENGNAGFLGSVTASSFLYSSDKSLKTNIQPLQNPLENVQKLQGVSFNWKESGKADIGLIAQDVEKVFPELVSTNSNGIKSVEYGNIVAVLIESIKEQQKQIDELKLKCG